jgi:hypothetical protein
MIQRKEYDRAIAELQRLSKGKSEQHGGFLCAGQCLLRKGSK